MNKRWVLVVCALVVGGLSCMQESPLQGDLQGPVEIQPLCKLAAGMVVSDIASAHAEVSGRGISTPLRFELLIDRTNNPPKLYGTLLLPEGIKAATVTIRMYDGAGKKIGQGMEQLNASHFSTRQCITARININSARPRIDTLSAQPARVGINDSVRLHTVASDSFSGAIKEYAWKCGAGGDWRAVGDGDTTVFAPATAQDWLCSLRVTDDDGNTVYDTLTIVVETRGPTPVTSPDTVVGINDVVHLRGSESHDEDGRIVEYAWQCGEGGGWRTDADGDTTVIAPATPGQWWCTLRVTDDEGCSATYTVVIRVEVRKPIVFTSPDTTVGINDAVHLRGSESYDDGRIVEYAWKCGSEGAWHTDADGDTTVFAPSTEQSWSCSLRVSDDEDGEEYAVVEVQVESRRPIALTSPDTVVGINGAVHLRGSASRDDYGKIVEYAWKCGSEDVWRVDGDGDTTVLAPSTSQFWVCSLMVVDDDGTRAFAALEVVVGNPTVTDIDGNVYTTVIIGKQLWTVENLRTTRFVDSTQIFNIVNADTWTETTTPAYCWYGNSESEADQKKWGALYNWYTVATGKLAPQGWRVPSDSDWTILENYLVANGYNEDGTTKKNKIAKAMAAQTDWGVIVDGWLNNDISNNNRSGFTALPGGCRKFEDGLFDEMFVQGYWWSATGLNDTDAWYRYINTYGIELSRSFSDKRYGYSVRMVRDLP